MHAVAMQIHKPRLCAFHPFQSDEGDLLAQQNSTNVTIQASLTKVYRSHAINWVKVWLIREIVSRGVPCLQVDTDMVFFRNPFHEFAADADVVASSNFDWHKPAER